MFDDLYDLPFMIHGRGNGGYDCYGLVIEVERRLGREMKDLYEEYTKENYLERLDENTRGFIENMNLVKTDRPSYGDIIVFFENGKSVHVAVYLNRDDFIHCDGRGVHIDNLRTYFRKDWEGYKWQD